MSENTRLDIDSNIPQEMDKIGKAADAAAKKLDKLGSGSAFEELQRTMKAVSSDFKNFGGTVDKAFEKALKNLDSSAMPKGIRDVYRNSLILAKSGSKELAAEYEKLNKSAESAANRVVAAQEKIAKATSAGKTAIGAQKELKTAANILVSLEGKFADARENAKNLKFFHLQLRDALNKEYNEFYLKRQATQKTANLAELQAWKDLGVNLQGEDAVRYKKLLKDRKDYNTAVAAETARATAISKQPYSELSTGNVKNLKEFFGPPKSAFQAAAEAKAKELEQVQQDALQRIVLRATVQAEGAYTNLRTQKTFYPKDISGIFGPPKQLFDRAVKENDKAVSALAGKDQEFINRYNNATRDLLAENKARAENLLQYLSVVKAVAEKSSEYATKKFGTVAVSAATGTEFENLNNKLAGTQAKMPSLLQGFKTLGGRLIDVHSATRGLASGFNLLWLTWGQMGPLFTGAAISMGTKSIVTMGASIGHQLEIIKVLSEESDAAVSGLNDQLMAIAKSGPYGPLQVAEALKTLSLAGLDATQVSQALPRVLQFAAAGTTSIEKAADVMTGVATAFGYTAESFNIVGDIVTKTAAVSKAGIEDMGEAFKAGSVVSTQFGVSIKDVSLLLALQANLNIKNSAAGTNVRNLYTDLAGRSKEARKLMKELNLELTDSSGRFKDVVTLAKELDGALSKFTGKGARDIQLRLLGERGGKAFVPVLAAYRTEVREVSVVNGQMVETVTNQLEQLKKKTEDNYGFMALAAAQLSMTPLKQMESVVSTFQASIAQAFSGMEDEVIVTSARLKEVFNSQEFASALKNLIIGVASLTEALLGNLDVVSKVVLGYVGFKVLATTASLFIGLHSAVKAGTDYLAVYSTQQAKSSAVNAAASVATNGVAIATASVGSNLLKAIPIIGTIVSVGTAAWSMWELYNVTQGKTADVTQAAADGIRNSGMIEALDSENERLLKQVAILDLSLKLKRQVTEQEFNSMQKAEEAAASEAKRVGQVVASAKALEAEEVAVRQAEANLTSTLAKTMGQEAKSFPAVLQLRNRAEEIAKARSLLSTTPVKSEVEYKVARNSTVSKVVSDMTDQLNKTLREQKVTGTKIFDPDAANLSTKALTSAIEKQISAIVKGGNAQLNELKSNYDLANDLLEAKHKAGIVSEGVYQAELIKQTSSGEAAQLKAIEDTEAKLKPLYSEALSKYKQGSAEYTALDEKRVAEFESLEAKRVEIVNAANKRQQISVIEHQGKLLKAQQESEKYLADLRGERAKEAALSSLNSKYDSVTDSSVIWLQAEKAGAVAAAEATAKHEAELRKMEKAYEDVAKAEADMRQKASEYEKAGIAVPGLPEAFTRLSEQRMELEKQNATTRVAIEKDIADQSTAAYNEAFRKRASEFKSTVAQTLAEALVAGGNGGGKSLRKILEAELKAPFVLMFRMSIDALLGDLGKSVSGAVGSSEGGGGLSNAFSALSSASTLSSAYNALSGAVEGSIGKSFEKFATSTWGEKFGLSQSSNAGYTLPSDLPGTMTEATDAFTTATSEMTSLGKTFTDVGTRFGAAFVGQGLRKGISGGYSVGGAGEKVMDVAALVAGFEKTGLASIVTGAVSGLINRAFGRKLKDTGIQGQFGSQGFTGESYRFEKGGWFRSDRTKTSALDSSTTNTFTNTFRSIQASTAVLATNMGLSAQSALDFQKNIKVSLNGLSPEEQSTALTKMFTDMQEEMAKSVLDAWGDWSVVAKYGETASQVLTTVSNNLTGFNGMLSTLGLRLIDLSLSGAAAASSVIEAAGGVDALTGIYSSYYENFYSEAERNSKSIETLGEKFTALGMTMPALAKDAEGFVINGGQARETFRGLVSAATNVGNIELATELVKLSGAFAEVTPLAEKFLKSLQADTKNLEIELLKAQGNTASYTAALRTLETQGMTRLEVATYDYNKSLEAQIEMLGKVDEAKSTAASAEVRLLEAQGKATEALAKQREIDTKGMSAAEAAAYDYSKAVDNIVEFLGKLKAATETAANAGIRLLNAQGRSEAALAKQRELDTASMSRAEVVAYDYAAAIDAQISKIEKAADIVSKLGSISTDLGTYLQQFEADTSEKFSETIRNALEGDLAAMGEVTSQADKAIENARKSSRSTAEFNVKQATLLGQVRKVKDFADTVVKLSDTDKIIEAIKGDTKTSEAVNTLKLKFDGGTITAEIAATLTSIEKSPGAIGDTTAIQGLFSNMKATITSMTKDSAATTQGQTILGMFSQMQATVLSVAMIASEAEIAKVTSAFSSLTAFVTKVSASNLPASAVQTALGTAANITAAINAVTTNGVTSTASQTVLGDLANVSAIVNKITTKDLTSTSVQTALGSLANTTAWITKLQTTEGIITTQKDAITTALSGFTATISSITLANTVKDGPLKNYLSGKATTLSAAMTIGAAITAGTGDFGLTAQQTADFLNANKTVNRVVNFARTGAAISEADRTALTASTGTVEKTLNLVKGSNTLTDAEKTLLGIIGGSENGYVTVQGTVEYEAAKSFDTLIGELNGAISLLTTAVAAQAKHVQDAVDLAKAKQELPKLGSNVASSLSTAQNASDKVMALAYQNGYLGRGFASMGVDLSNGTTTSNPVTLDALAFGGQAKFNKFLAALRAQGLANYVDKGQLKYDFSAVLPDLEKAKAYTKILIANGLTPDYGGSSKLGRSYGVGDSPGLAGLAPAIPGGIPFFARGGYTGPGSVNEVAGIVHKGEVVWSQQDIANAGGLSIVEALRKGGMPEVASSGGWKAVAETSPASDGGYNVTQTSVSLDETALLEELKLLREEVASLRYEARATAVNTGNATKYLRDFDARGLTVKTDADTPLHTTTV